MIEKLKELSTNIRLKKGATRSEEATKHAFILPFFSLLGYNVNDPEEFIPEEDANIGKKKDAKVDYSISLNGKPILIIEAKHHKENLDNHITQLSHYYNATTTKFAVLTNGIEYRFFADLKRQNVLDKQPFFTFNLFDFGEQDVKVLKYFRKNSFDTLILSNLAEEMRYKSQSRQTIKNIIECPDDDFIRYVLSLIHEGKKTQQLVDRLRPIIKSSIDTVIDEMVKEKIEQALANLKEVANNPISSDDDPVANEIKTTKEELEAFFNIKYILRNTVPWDKLHYRDAKSYFSILYDNKNYKWICRLRVEKTNKYIIFPDGTPSGKSYPIEDLNDIFAFGDEIIESAKRFVEEQ